MKLRPLVQSPCKDCTDRVAPTKETNGCRPNCEKWKDYTEKYKEMLEKKKHDYEIKDVIVAYDQDRITKAYKAQAKDKRRKGPK